MTVTGLDALLERFADPDRPVGVATLLGMRPVTVERGLVVFEADAVPSFANPMGGVHGGILATLLDSAMGALPRPSSTPAPATPRSRSR